MNRQDMTGRVALVTGGSSGIGSWAALALAECGATVAINYHRNHDGAAATRAQIEANGGRAITIQADVSQRLSANALIEETRRQLGPIDILVNNAGDLIQRSPLVEFPDELLDQVIDLNFKSVLYCSQAVMREMMARRTGTIINVGSIAGHHGGGPGAAVYAATKAAVMCLTKGMAREMSPFGVRVNGVAPGVIDTPFHEKRSTPEQMAQFVASIPMNRVGTSEECGRVIAFLASDAASYLHGEMIEINGGQMMI
ncbi:MAG: SDR family NAD(P)-dependent oxidoreductase [Acidobacteriota bacterium]|jgi:3-oxoacyl-[acyl-carrier protein] reductase